MIKLLSLRYSDPTNAPNAKLVARIQSGCSAAVAASDSSDSSGTNLLFVAMQYLVICMIFNRLITEAANMAGALIGASGISTNNSQEVAGATGTLGRGGSGKGGSGNKQGGKGNGQT